jgi:hypothetical protein
MKGNKENRRLTFRFATGLRAPFLDFRPNPQSLAAPASRVVVGVHPVMPVPWKTPALSPVLLSKTISALATT